MEKKGTLIRLAELWRNEDIKNRDLLLIARDGMMVQSSIPRNAKVIANLLLNVMSENAGICEGVKLAAKHYDSVADTLRKDNEAKPAGKKALS